MLNLNLHIINHPFHQRRQYWPSFVAIFTNFLLQFSSGFHFAFKILLIITLTDFTWCCGGVTSCWIHSHFMSRLMLCFGVWCWWGDVQSFIENLSNRKMKFVFFSDGVVEYLWWAIFEKCEHWVKINFDKPQSFIGRYVYLMPLLKNSGSKLIFPKMFKTRRRMRLQHFLIIFIFTDNTYYTYLSYQS